jgi:hypothetical protein
VFDFTILECWNMAFKNLNSPERNHTMKPTIEQLIAYDPDSAACYLKDRLSDAQVTMIVERSPVSAAKYLKDRLK